jgi:hypothetical protein
MIALYREPSHFAGASDIPALLQWAETLVESDDAPAVDYRVAGVCLRLAFEFRLHDLCRDHGPPKGEKWHSFAIRLLKVGVFTMDDYRHVRRINRLAARAVHGKPFDRFRAKVLLELVTEFLES